MGLLVTLSAASALVVAMVLASVLTGHGSAFDVFAIVSVATGWIALAMLTRRRSA